MDKATRLFSLWRKAVVVLSSEWVLTKWRIPNGGAAVLFRALISGVIIFSLVLVFLNVSDPMRTWQFSSQELRTQIIEKFPWFAAIFAGIYTALYARFSSQWSYLANLYNSIKQVEINAADKEVLAEWKAGFMEDAETLAYDG